MRKIYNKQKLEENYSKYVIRCRGGKLLDNKNYIVCQFYSEGGQGVVEVEEVEFIN